ncbi:MAG: hypothetical protein ACSLE5_09900 [Porticoccaceae bacterium]
MRRQPTNKRNDALKRWHRRIGLTAALFVLVLAATGFCLNHSGHWQWDRLALRSPLLLRWYGIALPGEIDGYPLDQSWLSQLGGKLFLDLRSVGDCQGSLVGALRTEEQIIVACTGELVLFTHSGEVIERIGSAHSLPTPVERIGGGAGQLFLQARAQHFTSALDALTFIAVAAPAGVSWSAAQPLPARLTVSLAPFVAGDSITLERILLDIHSGRILGSWGIYLVDAMAGLFVLLAITGVIAWRRGDRS